MLARKFEERVEQNPHNIAVKTGNQTYTYRQLNRFANRIAGQIKEKENETGAPSGSLDGNSNGSETRTVALLFEHGADMIAAILGSLKAEKIYVPLAVDYPLDRLSYIISDAQAQFMLCSAVTQSLAQELARMTNVPVITIDDAQTIQSSLDQADRTIDDENSARSLQGERIAYILYTSGSTGRPKGVCQTHENTGYYNRNWIRVLGISRTDRMTLFSSFCHDGSVQDIYSALHSGAALYPVNMKNRDADIEISDFLIQEKITIWHSVPSLFSFFAASLDGRKQFPDLRFIMLGGEAVREHEIEMLNRYFPHSIMGNVYGQTESSVNSICLIKPGSDNKIPSIGTPYDKTQIFLIDEEGDPVEPLQTGEIVIACAHLAPGYWRKPEAAEAAFDYDEEYGRLYWTGDLGRLRLDGSIEFLGRKDYQVKIRGFRVEPGEIESRLLEHERIKEAVVVDRAGDDGEKVLCAYVILKDPVLAGGDNLDFEISSLRDYLSRLLPDYMIPTYFTRLEKFPLTVSGKIDRRALPQPQAAIASRYVSPADAIESKLLHIWSEVLAAADERIGVEGSFFEFGGHSLKAVTLTEKAHKEFGVKVPLAVLFKQPTVRQMAEYIKTAEKEHYVTIVPVEKKEVYPLSVNQKRMWLLHELTPGTGAYNLPARFELDHGVDIRVLAEVFRGLMLRHDALRTKFIKIKNEPFQVILPAAEIPIRREDVSDLTGEQQLERRQQIFLEITEKPFDLLKAPLFRVALVHIGAEHDELMFSLHHIVGDGWSMDLLRKDFIAMYDAISEGKQAQLPEMEFQYKDFVEWSNQRARDAAYIENSERFWKQRLEKGIPILSLPVDFDENKDAAAGAAYSYPLDAKRKEALLKLAETHNTSLFMVMFSAYLILLSRLSKQAGVLCSIIGAGREHMSWHQVIGFFVNSIVFLGYVDKEKSFSDFLRGINDEVLEFFQHQSYAVEKIFAELKIRYPEIPVSFNMLNIQEATQEVPILSFEAQHVPTVKDIKFDIEPYISGFSNGISMVWTYRKSLFAAETMEFFVKEYVEILDYFSAHPQDTVFAYRKEKQIKISRKG